MIPRDPQARLRSVLAACVAALLLAVPGPRPAHADLMRKAPYLVFPAAPGRMKVLWQLTATDTCRIAWGTDTSCSQGSAPTAEYGADHQHAFTLAPLAPGTTYHYRVTQGGTAWRGSFRTAPAPGATSLKFFAYGDTRTLPQAHDSVAAGVLALMAADPGYRTFDLCAGDLVADGDLESYWTDELFNPAYPRVRELLANLPLVSCMGNHEAGGALFAKYFPYDFAGGRYGSFDYGPAHVAVVDQYTGYAPGTPQYDWLAADLAASRAPWKFVLLHEPGWSAGGGHANNVTVQDVLEPLCEQNHVAIVFAGHNHYYARARVDGVTHITAGFGGAPLHTPDPGYPNVQAVARTHGFCAVSIALDTLTLRALSVTGETVDSVVLTRGGPDSGVVDPGAPRLALDVPEPNPGHESTLLGFSLPRAGHARLEILDLGGRRVWHREAELPAGAHAWRWDGRDDAGAQVRSGLYFARLVTRWGTRGQRLAWVR